MANTSENVAAVRKIILDKSLPIAKRFRCIFTLKNLGGREAIDALCEALDDKSALLKHEIAFVLGQMADPYAIPTLNRVLRDLNEEPMVRHEAGEALGAIAQPESIPVLEEFLNDPAIEVSETCQIALDRIKHFQDRTNGKSDVPPSPFDAIDPAPAHKKKKTTAEARAILLDQNLTLFRRYRALFTLRDRGDTEAVEAICAGFDDPSALFRHEIAFVLGQLQHPASIEALKKVLARDNENPMVRHEAAEALGAIATEDCIPMLDSYSKDSQDVVKESCEVALDIHNYFTSNEFQYADGLVKRD